MRVQIVQIRNSVEGSCAERRNTASLVVEGEAARAFAWRIRAALWLLLAAMFFAGSAAGQDQKQADLGGLSIEDLAKVKVESVYGASKFLQKASDVPGSVAKDALPFPLFGDERAFMHAGGMVFACAKQERVSVEMFSDEAACACWRGLASFRAWTDSSCTVAQGSSGSSDGAPRCPALSEKRRKPKQIRVLVVDDSPVSRKLLEHSLAGTSYEVVFAQDGSDALRVFAEHSPDLAIVDWELPDISGPEMCGVVRSKLADAYTYLMLLTSNSDKKSIAEGLAAGADDYLIKTFDAEELRARVGVGRRVIEMHREIEAKTKALALEARTDPLTGLPNRRAVEEWAVKQISGAVRHGYPIWVVLADLDSYKPATDLFGRDAGDAMLQPFGEIIKKNTRVSDTCGHMGGDQFTFVISHVSRQNMDLVINRWRDKIANYDFSYHGTALPLFANFGLAGSEGGERLELRTMLQQADAALLEAKRAALAIPVPSMQE